MSNRNRTHANGKSASVEKLVNEILEKKNVEVLNTIMPNQLKKQQNISEKLKVDLLNKEAPKISEVIEPCKNEQGALHSMSIPVQASEFKAPEICDFKKLSIKDMENCERHYNKMAETGMEPGIFAKKPDHNMENEELYYFKYMVPAGRPPRLPLSDLVKDMLKQSGIRGPDLFRQVPYKMFGPLNGEIFKDLKKSADNKLKTYLRQKVGINEVSDTNLSDIFHHFGIKFSNRVIIPKIVAFMGSGVGKLLLKFLRK